MLNVDLLTSNMWYIDHWLPGAEGGFIDDVVAGERLVVKRTAKDLSYQALRLINIAWSGIARLTNLDVGSEAPGAWYRKGKF